jgi:hypothetical protein
MTGTASQIEWAGQIRARVDAEFHRVAEAFRTAAGNQLAEDRRFDRDDTMSIVAILEEKRREAMANDHAGYFIRNWQELTDQVRRTIAADARYREIKSRREMRRHAKSQDLNV